jgi:type IV pilus assembly protein PilA
MVSKQNGFSVIEMMVVVAILGILAMIAIPSSIGRIVKEQVLAAIPLADIAKEPIAAAWKEAKTLPINNEEAGLPAPEKVVSNFVSSLEVKDGVIHITFGNKAHPQIKGKILSFRPAVIEESQIVPIAWVCGSAKAPNQMTIKGENKTNVSKDYLPLLCR